MEKARQRASIKMWASVTSEHLSAYGVALSVELRVDAIAKNIQPCDSLVQCTRHFYAKKNVDCTCGGEKADALLETGLPSPATCFIFSTRRHQSLRQTMK